MASIEIIGMADEGACDHCGANCPRRRVAVRAARGAKAAAGQPR